jgi:hypothetical protein
MTGDSLHHLPDDREALRAVSSIIFNIVRPVVLYKRGMKHAVSRVDSEKHVSLDHGLVNVARPTIAVQDFMPPKVGGIGDMVRFPAVDYRFSGDINAAREKCLVLKANGDGNEVLVGWCDCPVNVLLRRPSFRAST